MYQSVIFMPHPPIIMEEFGDSNRNKALCTIEGMMMLSKMIAKIKPETIIFVSPHGNSFSNGTCILNEPIIQGDFSQFGRPEISYTKKINQELTQNIYDRLEEKGFVTVMMNKALAKTYSIQAKLDHGAMVPISFIDKEYSDYTIVHITPGQTPLEENYYIGKLIKDVVDEYTEQNPSRVLVVSSGDMSHALKDDGPYAFNECGHGFDQVMRDAIASGSPLGLIKLKPSFIENAAQCGLRSFLMGFGYMDGLDLTTKVISYEGPFGVGYLCGYLTSDTIVATQSVTHNKGNLEKNDLSKIPTIQDLLEERYQERLSLEDEFIQLARETIEYYVHHTKKLSFAPQKYSQEFIQSAMNSQRGIFVSIHRNGQLRGCIGTIEPNCDNLLEEIIYNSISACSADPRFHPIEREELKDLDIKVDVLFPIEGIESSTQLDVKRYGVVVEQGYKRGLLLPNLEGINTIAEQISIAKQKAGIVSGKVNLFRFEVERHEVE